MAAARNLLYTFRSMRSFLALDFEIATRDPLSACALGLVRCEKGRITARERRLIRPPSADFTFTYIHGLSWPDVASAPDFPTNWTEIAHWFDGVDFLAAHNAGFDRSVLSACCNAWGLAMPTADWVCSVQLARRIWGLNPADLKSCARFLCVPLDHHEALSDANACAEIILAAEAEGWRHEMAKNTAAGL
jgi:DNA polymerase-3 subunit epsilon